MIETAEARPRMCARGGSDCKRCYSSRSQGASLHGPGTHTPSPFNIVGSHYFSSRREGVDRPNVRAPTEPYVTPKSPKCGQLVNDHFTRDTLISAFQLSSALQLTAPAPGWELPGSLTHCW
jgi:hypothetical protein